MSITLTDLNQHGGIGANCHFFQFGSFRIVIDAGAHPKKWGLDALPRFDLLDPSASLDAVIVTHCHLDHIGGLPVLMRNFPDVPVIMSTPSHIIARRMWHNSINVMLRQRDERGIREYPLYTHGEVERLSRRIWPLAYERPLTLEKNGQELAFTFHPSGHVPGACGVEFNFGGKRLFCTGDVLFSSQSILKGARFPDHPVDVVVTETTRGLTERAAHTDRQSEIKRLFQTICTTLGRGGSVLIPVFALGRMQELIALFRDARKSGELPLFPLYISGLGIELAEQFDDIHRKTGLVRFERKWIKELKARPMRETETLKPGRDPQEKAVYLVSSGMMVENTPSYGVAASLLENPANCFCFVGYCDPDTPGGALRRIQDGETYTFNALDYAAPFQAQREIFDLSGHADRSELIAYALGRKPSSIVLTHGDPEARNWFKEAFASSANGFSPRVIDPPPLEPVVLIP